MSFFKKRDLLLKSNVALNPGEDQDALIERLTSKIASLETQIASLQSENVKLRDQLNNIFSIARYTTIASTQPVPSEDASVETQKNEKEPTTEVAVVNLKPVVASKPTSIKETTLIKKDERSGVKSVLGKFFNDVDAQKSETKAWSSSANPSLQSCDSSEDETPAEEPSVDDYYSDSSFDSTSDPSIYSNDQPCPAPMPPSAPRPNAELKNISSLYDKILQRKTPNVSNQNNKYSYATTDPTQESEGTPSTPIMPGGAAPGTPSSKVKEKPSTPRNKVVVALYPFKAIETGDLSLEKGAEYEVVDDSQEHWWKVKDEKGSMGYIPSNYVKEKELLGLQKYEWYVGDMSRQRAETLLKQEDKEGCFVVRNSSTKGMYTLSLYTKVPHPHSKHYHIKNNSRGDFYLSDKHCCGSVAELVNYHKHNAGGLCSRLKTSPCDRPAPPTAGLSHDKWEIDPSELVLHEELGSGQFGVVRRGIWRGTMDTAVKMMKEGTMSEDDFIEEAKVMTKLQHQNLVQLYGVCSKHRPIFIVTEYMKHGSLLNYLRRHENTLSGNTGMLLDMCVQVCKGMAYLERHNYIHRDLAARNCLVGWENVVKVADFGLARYVLDDQYTSSGGTKFPIKWAPPEVLNYTRFSSKSDIWAYGVLMWEVFTCGKMPYGRLKNSDVVERVQRGIVLEKPKFCVKEAYDVMRKCWAHNPEDRPSFRTLKEQLMTISEGLLAD